MASCKDKGSVVGQWALCKGMNVAVVRERRRRRVSDLCSSRCPEWSWFSRCRTGAADDSELQGPRHARHGHRMRNNLSEEEGANAWATQH